MYEEGDVRVDKKVCFSRRRYEYQKHFKLISPVTVWLTLHPFYAVCVSRSMALNDVVETDQRPLDRCVFPRLFLHVLFTVN